MFLSVGNERSGWRPRGGSGRGMGGMLYSGLVCIGCTELVFCLLSNKELPYETAVNYEKGKIL
jgi:hypothetical protein